MRAISLLRCSTSRIERRKSFRTALSRLPASVDDVGANIALQPRSWAMLPQISALFTSLMDHFRKTEFPSLASKSLLLAVVDGIHRV